MAKIKSMFQLSGSAGAFTFVNSKNGCYLRQKSTISKHRFKTDPAFQRLREQSTEFGRASKAGKLIRDALIPALNGAKDSKCSNRLSAELWKIMKEDQVHQYGHRRLLPENLEQLQGFQFNEQARLESVIHCQFDCTISRHAGTAAISIPSFIPRQQIAERASATHCRLVMATIEPDFETSTCTADYTESAFIALENVELPPITITNKITTGTTLPVFVCFGIHFYQVTNGRATQMFNASFNSLSLIKVS